MKRVFILTLVLGPGVNPSRRRPVPDCSTRVAESGLRRLIAERLLLNSDNLDLSSAPFA